MKFLSMLLLFAFSTLAMPLFATENSDGSDVVSQQQAAVDHANGEAELASDIQNVLDYDLELSNGLSGIEINKHQQTLLAKSETPHPAAVADEPIEKYADSAVEETIEAKTEIVPEADQALAAPAAVKTTDANENPFYRLIFLGVFGLFAAIAGYLYLRKKQRQMGVKASDIKILSQTYLGPKKSVAILRVAGESILIGITDTNINMIKSLSLLDEDIPSETPKKFNSIFKGAAEAESDDGDDSYHQRALLDEEEEAFEYNGLQDAVVNRIKSLKEIGSR